MNECGAEIVEWRPGAERAFFSTIGIAEKHSRKARGAELDPLQMVELIERRNRCVPGHAQAEGDHENRGRDDETLAFQSRLLQSDFVV